MFKRVHHACFAQARTIARYSTHCNCVTRWSAGFKLGMCMTKLQFHCMPCCSRLATAAVAAFSKPVTLATFALQKFHGPAKGHVSHLKRMISELTKVRSPCFECTCFFFFFFAFCSAGNEVAFNGLCCIANFECSCRALRHRPVRFLFLLVQRRCIWQSCS